MDKLGHEDPGRRGGENQDLSLSIIYEKTIDFKPMGGKGIKIVQSPYKIIS